MGTEVPEIFEILRAKQYISLLFGIVFWGEGRKVTVAPVFLLGAGEITLSSPGIDASVARNLYWSQEASENKMKASRKQLLQLLSRHSCKFAQFSGRNSANPDFFIAKWDGPIKPRKGMNKMFTKPKLGLLSKGPPGADD